MIHIHKCTLALTYNQLSKTAQTQGMLLFVGEMRIVVNEILSN